MQSWLCPTDRQLRLRACIARGWSTPGAAVVSLRTPAECAAVGEVLRRDRALRLLDSTRVVRAADRLERLRLAQRGDGLQECRLCGCRLHWWRRHAEHRCNDCGLLHCDDCGGGVGFGGGDCCGRSPTGQKHKQVWLCRVCRETRLLIAQSGAWFYGGQASLVPAVSQGQADLQLNPLPSQTSPPPAENSHQPMTSPPDDSSSASSCATSLGAGRWKSRSHCDFRREEPAAAQSKKPAPTPNSHRLQRERHLAIIRRRQSASCSQLGQMCQREYFPTELANDD